MMSFGWQEPDESAASYKATSERFASRLGRLYRGRHARWRNI